MSLLIFLFVVAVLVFRIFLNVRLYYLDERGGANLAFSGGILLVTSFFLVSLLAPLVSPDGARLMNGKIYAGQLLPFSLIGLDLALSLLQVGRAFRSDNKPLFRLFRCVSLLLLPAVFFAGYLAVLSAK